VSNIAAIGAVPPEILGDLPPLPAGAGAAPQGPAPSVPFGELFAEGLSQVNDSLLTSQTDMQRLATGEVQNLHQLMIRLEESRINFQLMLQVRNRLLEAYQDVMKMQI
jgi:flagellar hook-basal body complex protein FliE